jgi:hypothetical protein
MLKGAGVADWSSIRRRSPLDGRRGQSERGVVAEEDIAERKLVTRNGPLAQMRPASPLMCCFLSISRTHADIAKSTRLTHSRPTLDREDCELCCQDLLCFAASSVRHFRDLRHFRCSF